MFSLPSLISIPAISFYSVATLDVPTVGAFIGWALVAALVGSALGILRRMGRDNTNLSRSNNPTISLHVVHPVDVRHKEAA